MRRSILRWLPLALSPALLYFAWLAATHEDDFVPPRGPGVPNDWFFQQRAWPAGTIDYEVRREAIEETRRMRAEAAREGDSRFGKRAVATDWENVGPENVGGRVTDVIGNPANANEIYLAAASGGVWKSTDAGVNWTAIFDGQGSLSIGALAVDPNDFDVLYVGTGEANPGGGSVAYGGDGVWKTTDGGASWTHLGLTDTRYIGRIAIDPSDADNVFVAAMGNLFSKNVDRGVYRSTDAGQSWTKVLYVSDSTGCVDIAIDPGTPTRVFATMWERIRMPESRNYGGPTSGIWRSEDGGSNWGELTSGLPTSAGRIGVAVAPSNPARVYAVYADETGFFDGFYRSTDNGDTWSLRAAAGIGTFYSSFGWWFGRLWVDPGAAGTVWADGVLLYKTTNGGASFSDVTSSMHVDHHAQWINPNNTQVMLKGNDGGLYRTTNGGSSWSFVSNLPITQLYTIEVPLASTSTVYAGLQDNGTVRTTGGAGSYTALFGGDGHYVIQDPNDANTIYLEFQYGNFYRSTNGGGSFNSAVSGISGADRKNWSTPVVVDPASVGNPSTRLYFGANRLYRSTNSASSWTVVAGGLDFSDGFGGSGGVTFGTIATIAVAPSDSGTIYVGTDDANVWVSTDYAASFTQINTGLPDRWVSRVAVDPNNDAVAYATFSGLRSDDPLPHVFRTTNHGASWTDISGNLPDAPVNDIIVDEDDTNILYVGTDVGVFVTGDLGAAWSPLGNAIPEGAIVTDLDYVPGAIGTPNLTPLLFAATYGRSAYKLDLAVATGVDVAEEEAAGRPALATIDAVTPNPFRSRTEVTFTIPAAGHVRVSFYDLAGREVRVLTSGARSAGAHRVAWDGRDENGRAVANGVYFARVETGGRSESKKVTLVR